jgi:repressor LexA
VNALTTRQKEILDFMKDQVGNHGFPPTVSEIQKHFFFKSPNAAEQHLKALVRKGWIKRHPHKSRGIKIIEIFKGKDTRKGTIAVPLVGRISAGFPLLAEENIERTIAVDKCLLSQCEGLFALEVDGDSMIKAGIHRGDILIVHQQPMVENGDIVIALLGDEATVKRFSKRGETVTLLPENDSMTPVKVLRKEDFRILGKVVVTLRRL